MNLFVKGALAIAATSTVGLADPADSSDWLELDSEINSLATSYASSQGDGMGWSGLLRYSYTYSSDDVATGGSNDISGFNFEDADIAFWGGLGMYQWRVNFDLDGNSLIGGDDLDLEDAYIMFECDEYFTTTVGHLKANVLLSNSVNPEDQLFIDRTALGSAFDWWDAGIELNGSLADGMVGWFAGLSNGFNSNESDHRYWLRGVYHLGTGAGNAEGALGANDDLNGTIGATYYKDDTVPDNGMLYAFDFRGTSGPFGLGGEIAFVDEELSQALFTSGDFSDIAAGALFFGDDDDTTPYAVTASYLINDEWEAAVRYQDLDNFDDESIISVGVNWYRSGHNSKWQAGWTDVDSDGDDGSIFQVGVVLGNTD